MKKPVGTVGDGKNQQQSTLTEIYRLAYKAAGTSSSIEMVCSSVIDIWSNFRVTDVDGTIWSPEHLMMTGTHFRMTIFEDFWTLPREKQEIYVGAIHVGVKICKIKYELQSDTEIIILSNKGNNEYVFPIWQPSSIQHALGYEFLEPEDKTYGILHNDQWTGLIRELVDKRADIAWMPITIEETRAKSVTFSSAQLVYSGGNIIYKKKLDESVSSWKEVYTQPFQIEVLKLSSTVINV
ncbi:Glutamate receptor ionotropic, delta-1 [Nymphon striatum]|nr:Glutamate receptor ionotropic, delta-1 [Nymphon striatum]